MTVGDVMTQLCAISDKLDKVLERLDERDRQTDVLLTPTQAARHCGVSLTTFYRWKERRIVKPITRGGVTGYLRNDLNRIKRQ